jgi:hypothetical protein
MLVNSGGNGIKLWRALAFRRRWNGRNNIIIVLLWARSRRAEKELTTVT